MEPTAPPSSEPVATDLRPWAVLVVGVAVVLRLSFLWPGLWQQPWTPHHFDEHILPYEALALWEGVTPREVGWPASTTRLILSAAFAGQLVAEEGRSIASAENTASALSTVAHWSGGRVSDAAPLYVTGRLISALTGVLQVVAVMFAVRAWVGPEAALLAGAVAATAPLAVSHSQLLLAEMTGALFTTWMLALTPALGSRRGSPFWVGVLAGLATASKFHFGLWLVLALAVCWLPTVDPQPTRRQRFSTSATLLAAFTVTVLALVPWLWINPALGLKEFAGVVAVKAGGGANLATALSTALRLLLSLGLLSVVGVFLGLRPLVTQAGRLGVALVAVGMLGLALLAASAIVFDRYSLVLLPAATMLAGAGYHALISRVSRLSVKISVIGVLVLGLPQAWAAVQDVGRDNSYHRAHAWMEAHLPDRSSVVVYSEDNQFIARDPEQLAQCADYAGSDAAYREKWVTNGVTAAGALGTPMRLAIVNDELFQAFWCARERLAARRPSFFVHRFHSEPRFQTMTIPSMRDQFRAGLTDPARGFDAVLVHTNLFPDLTPAATFETGSGPLLRLYLRPGTVVRSAGGS